MEGSSSRQEAPQDHGYHPEPKGGARPLNPLEPPSSSVGSSSSSSCCSLLVARLHKLLYRRMLIGVSDGRFFLGGFHCIDKQGNIILQDAVEYRSSSTTCSSRTPPLSSSPMDQRCLGLILIPSGCRISCHVDCSIDEHLSLISLDRE